MPKGKKTINSGVKASQEERALRVADAAKWLYQHPTGSWTEFIDHFTTLWGIQTNTVNIYRKEAFEKLNELIDDNLMADRKLGVVVLQRMYNRAASNGEHKLALEVLKELNKVQGLYVNRTDITTDGEKLEGFDISTLVSFSKTEDDATED